MANVDVGRIGRAKAEASRAYDRMSRWYGLFADPFERRYRRAGLRMLAPEEGERVLEVGFGTGESLAALAEDAGLAAGVDISPGMCRVARSRLRTGGLPPRVVCGDATDLPFRDDAFDALFTSFTLELLDTPDIAAALREFRRVLRSDGRLCVVSLTKTTRPSLVTRLYEWGHRHFPTYLDCRPIRVAESLAEAGFSVAAKQVLSPGLLPTAVVLARAP